MRPPNKCEPLPRRYRVDIGKTAMAAGFETAAQVRDECRLRAKLVSRTVPKWPDRYGRGALRLAAKLRSGGEGGTRFESLACPVYMREERIFRCGGIWQLMDVVGADDVRTFTIVPRTWEVGADDLKRVDPDKLLRSLRAALDSQGAKHATGWLIAYLHGEFDPVAEVYRLHVHGLAWGEMIDVVDALRMLPNYETRSRLKDGSVSAVYRRVRLSRVRLEQLPRPITYLIQSFWPARAVIVSGDGKRIRTRRKGRIKEPFHTDVLVWLDRWQLSQLRLMIGVRETVCGLKPTRLKS